MIDKYGAGQAPYCFPGTHVLRNRLGLKSDHALMAAEQALTAIAAAGIELRPPPYDMAYLQAIHHRLFEDLYGWAGEVRSVDISKDATRFFVVHRIEAEASKLFARLAAQRWLCDMPRETLIASAAEFFGDLSMIHPFREGNGRAQRIFFQHVLANAGYATNWWAVQADEWREANIAAVVCDYAALTKVFKRCISEAI